MRLLCRFILLQAVSLTAIGCCCRDGSRLQPEAITGRKLVEPADLLRLARGTQWQVATRLLGTTGQHCFTYLKEQDEYVLTTYFVKNRPDTKGGIAFYGLYRNGALEGILGSLAKNVERYPYRDTTATRPKTWSVEDESRIFEILCLDRLSRGDIEEVLERYANPRQQSEPSIPGVVWELLMTDDYAARIKRDYARNTELLRHFDGFRIALGMTKSEVDSILGAPAHTAEVRPDLLLSIYAKKIHGEDKDIRLDINPLCLYSPVAVVFQNGKAGRVYSRGFISRDWMPDGPDYGL